MITSADLAQTPVFANVEESERQRLARKAADIRLSPGDWAIREGEEPRFFVILEGTLEAVKYIVGQKRVLGVSNPGDFSGETPIFLGSTNLVSLQALTPCRMARFERQQLQELVRDSPAAGELIFQTMTTRLSTAQQVARDTPSARVLIIGSKYDRNCRALRSFLSAHRIQYDWRPNHLEPENAELSVSVDGGEPLINPTDGSILFRHVGTVVLVVRTGEELLRFFEPDPALWVHPQSLTLAPIEVEPHSGSITVIPYRFTAGC